MAIDTTAEITIRRPRAEVAAFVTDPGNDRRWIRALTDVQADRAGPAERGDRVRRTARMMGRPIVYTTEVVNAAPGSRLEMRTVEGPFPMRVTYEFLDGGGGTRVRVRNQGGSGPMFALAGPLIAWMVNRRVQGDLQALKRALEGE